MHNDEEVFDNLELPGHVTRKRRRDKHRVIYLANQCKLIQERNWEGNKNKKNLY